MRSLGGLIGALSHMFGSGQHGPAGCSSSDGDSPSGDSADARAAASKSQERLAAVEARLRSAKRTGSVTPALIRELIRFLYPAEAAAQLAVRHERVACDSCGVCPIPGARFKSAIRHDYDLCAVCEHLRWRDSDKGQVFIKIRHPTLIPAAISVTLHEHQGRDGVPSAMSQAFADADPVTADAAPEASTPATWDAPRRTAKEREEEELKNAILASISDPTAHQRRPVGVSMTPASPAAASQAAAGAAPRPATTSSAGDCPYRTELIASNILCGERGIILPGSTFTKTWRLRNSGATAWPKGCRLVCIDDSKALKGPVAGVPINGIVNPGDEHVLVATFRAPDEPGRYNSFWRIVTADGTRFGKRLWVDAVVHEEPGSAPAATAPAASEAAAPPAPAAAAAAAATAPPAPAAEPAAASEAGEAGRFAAQHRALADMGIPLGPKVVALLEKHKGNLHQVIDELLQAHSTD